MFSRSLWALSAFSALAFGAPLTRRQATVCNGHAELCDRLYSNVTYIGAHDSFAFSSDPLALARDQTVDVPTQLSLGVRLLQGQAHTGSDGVLHFCHTSCALFDGGTVADYLGNVKTFLDANPNEVLTLLFTNPEGADVSTVWKPIFDAAGISDLAYVPPSIPVNQSSWPTLGDMISSGKRVVVFLDAGADGANPVPFILPEFQMIWETPFSVTDASFPCSIDRINGPLPSEEHMYMINHSLNINIIPIGDGVIVSDPADAPTTNGVDSILANANGCVPLGANRNPNFVLLDFVDQGDAFTAADQLHGLASS
ncbi:Transcription factor IIIB 60 kDa subunit [Mycena sanguinolenta]|uniref:Transcription factor IIIB 60 kDa subunit n=1 Tax=Mycena sanguinolenta TaxID=230812 RepID=A0A8H6YGY6_9AGAR|nr:Transcription factor IIIB 60 kDa subunit [Mycena sanguinolenta]